nr:hypothetical protein [Burkholderia sp. BCC0322]
MTAHPPRPAQRGREGVELRDADVQALEKTGRFMTFAGGGVRMHHARFVAAAGSVVGYPNGAATEIFIA